MNQAERVTAPERARRGASTGPAVAANRFAHRHRAGGAMLIRAGCRVAARWRRGVAGRVWLVASGARISAHGVCGLHWAQGRRGGRGP
jgi:hypothetical protein